MLYQFKAMVKEVIFTEEILVKSLYLNTKHLLLQP